MPPRIRINWNQPEIVNWIGTERRPLNKSRDTYIRAFETYYEFTRLTPKQLIDEAEGQERLPTRQKGRIKRQLLGFRKWLLTDYVAVRQRSKPNPKKGISSKGATTYLNAIRGFYSANNFPIQFKRKEIPKAQAQTERKMLRIEDVKKLLAAAYTQRDKTMILAMYQSGMDISTLLSLNFAHVREGLSRERQRIMVKVVRGKTAFKYRTFFGKDAVIHLKNYLLERERLRLGDPLFVTEGLEEKPRRLATGTVQTMFRRLVVRAGLVTEEELEYYPINPCGPHALRESFSKIATAIGLNKNLIDYLQGHETEYSGVYSQLPDEELEKAYADLEPSLTVSRAIASAMDKLREQARFWGIDFDRIIERETTRRMREMARTGAGTGGGMMYKPLTTFEGARDLLMAEIKRTLAPKTATNGGSPLQKVVMEDAVEGYLLKGWRYVGTLNGDKIIVERT